MATPYTAGLKKVTNEMKTYKNPALKASSVVKAGDAPKPSSGPKAAAGPVQKKPPVFQLQGKRWAVVSVGVCCVMGRQVCGCVWVCGCAPARAA